MGGVVSDIQPCRPCHQFKWKTASARSRMSNMERSFPTLFKKARGSPAAPPGDQQISKGIKIPIIFLPIYLPLFFILGALSIPVTFVQRLKQNRDEREFLDKMRGAARFMTWCEFKQAIKNSEGTAIGEYISTKGPFRLWWTPENIPATSPHTCDRENHLAWLEEDFRPFFEWCYAQFTNPHNGSARLVCVPDEERNALKKTLATARFVSTCSFASVRRTRTSEN